MPDESADPSFRRVEEVFHAALDLEEGSSRQAFLRVACGDDFGLLQRIESLLEAHAEAAGREKFLREHPASDLLEKTGDRIGQYVLVEQIGVGTFGSVWKAAQEKPLRREVALKIIKAGMDTRQVIGRFEAERQALAMMDHPHIAKVFDAGATKEGRPYFVMELVRGIKITDYCDQHKLSIRERLALFCQICRAIQHAHDKGIIHRDIKPSNVLVSRNDGLAAPKVIDFGIAKATDQHLTENPVVTVSGQILGTPAYMSPEQAGMKGRDIDSRSDIYSLGVLLYELLTGQPPINKEELQRLPLDEILRAIRENETLRPSVRLARITEQELSNVAQCRQIEPARLPKLLRNELDWVVMKCLEKDRARRYQTAGDLADDIQRHLDNRPLLQGLPPGMLYRMRNGIGRHRVMIGAASAVLALLAAIFLRMAKPPSPWQIVPVHVKGHAKPFEYNWKDLAWDRSNGWLCGFIDQHGGGKSPHVGHGVLVHTSDGGKSWENYDVTNIESGTGTNWHFNDEVWTEVGPIASVGISSVLQTDGKTWETNGWIASVTGIYHTTNAGSAAARWKRVTPPPNGAEGFSHFARMAQRENYEEIYAVGWQGIARWVDGGNWELQKKTLKYPILSVIITDRDVWAVGLSRDPDANGHGYTFHGAIYRQPLQETNWERVPLPGIKTVPGESFRDLACLRDQSIYVVGDFGTILRGSPERTNWLWQKLESGTKLCLNSITCDADDALWAVGDHGLILKSSDRGQTWVKSPCYDEFGKPLKNNFERIRNNNYQIWIMGDGVVLRSNPS